MAVLYPTRRATITAIRKAAEKKYIEPILIGPKVEIEKAFAESEADLGRFELITTDNPNQAVTAALNTHADCIFKGHLSVRTLAKLLLDPVYNFGLKGRLMTHIGIVKAKKYKRLMLITDGAVHANPSPAKKIQIIHSAAVLANRLGNENPKAALLAAVEAIYPAVPVTMEEAAIAKMSDRGQFKDVVIDGPLSFDCTISKEVAKAKGLSNSKVAGKADIFAMPSMETANGTYKAMIMYGKAEGAGIIFGGMLPIASPYLIDNERNILNSIILAAYLA